MNSGAKQFIGTAIVATLSAASFGATFAFIYCHESSTRDRLSVRRLDIIDSNGVVRMILAAPTPNPIVNGSVQKRRYPVSGLALFDEHGEERGGIGVADIPGGVPVLALDHKNFDAIGWKVLPDGSVSFGMNDHRDHVGQDNRPAERLRLQLSEDGTPSLQLADKQNRPRVRLSLDGQGAGVLQFLDTSGNVVQTLAPELVPKINKK